MLPHTNRISSCFWPFYHFSIWTFDEATFRPPWRSKLQMNETAFPLHLSTICLFRRAVLSHLKTYNLYYEGQNLQLRHREVCILVELPPEILDALPVKHWVVPHTPCEFLCSLLTGRGGADLWGLAQYFLGIAATNQAPDAGWPRANSTATLLHVLALGLQSRQSRVSGPQRSPFILLTGNDETLKVNRGRDDRFSTQLSCLSFLIHSVFCIFFFSFVVVIFIWIYVICVRIVR